MVWSADYTQPKLRNDFLSTKGRFFSTKGRFYLRKEGFIIVYIVILTYICYKINKKKKKKKSWSSLVAYLCTAGIAVPRIICFIVHCRYFLCDVAGVAHRITLRLRARRHLYLLFITSWRSRDGETLMLIHDKDIFVLVLIYCTKLFTKLTKYLMKFLSTKGRFGLWNEEFAFIRLKFKLF